MKKMLKRHVSEFAELDGGGRYFEKKYILRGCKLNRSFYKGENRK